MKNLSVFTFILVLISSIRLHGQTSNQAFFYSATFTPDSTNITIKGTDYMVLWVGDNYSVFESYYGYQLDSVQAAASSKTNNPKDVNLDALIGSVLSMKKPSYKFRIHKSWKDEQITFYQNLFFDNYVFIQPLKMNGWKIEKEFKDILGLKCQKASIDYSGRSFIAWFTEDIPMSDGPYVFNGLPGLILEVKDTQNYYSFELVGVQKSIVEMDKRVLPKTISLSKNQFFLTKKALYKDVRKALLGKPAGSTSDESIRMVQERYDKSNNPLELVVDK
ncbi:MAG: GLPGLI family protein [Algoriphagus sp.]|uniref:GLPGLI family protein n=1 Tax=Algoriphagus sp. TaxID=1872435 RepID=UPI002630B612|nr:GLPGLI family protein [Algoriphagus sp.]MDG1277829.1 GLPGLI family protein [Algoriphagus sp.]